LFQLRWGCHFVVEVTAPVRLAQQVGMNTETRRPPFR
jgi:hypothetical protein